MTLGGKAAGLLKLKVLAPVPPFVVFESEWIKGHVDNLEVALEDVLQSAGLHPPFAVRSSAADEDGALFAFAGMYETVLPVDWVSLELAVQQVWQSDQADRVAAYRAHANLTATGGAGVSVVVQEVVDATTAGVIFTRAPWDGDILALEAVSGLGSSLVDGEATPERHAIDRRSCRLLQYSPGRQFLARSAGGGTLRLTGRAVGARRLSTESALELARLALLVEKKWDPVANGLDIEWCIDHNERIFLLQCRPITTAPIGSTDRIDRTSA